MTEAGLSQAGYVERVRGENPAAAKWAAGFGEIRHSQETQARVFAMADALKQRGVSGDGDGVFEVLAAADRLASAAMWLVVHETYAVNVYLDGRPLAEADFKPNPEGHTGGALNMVPAYTGYLAVNAITGLTRSWVMGQGHVVAAIDSLNLLVGNMTEAHAHRYSATQDGLTRYVRDFYSLRLDDRGEQDSPLGSHVNVNTAGGFVEGGYLGFTELQYVHMPLRGERLVVFLSDGAFEEQRGSDWAPRWWRDDDTGLIAPIMIQNGRRIDQRTTLSQQGGSDWLAQHLRLNSFEPFIIDGTDPAAFAWAVFEIETRLEAAARAVREGTATYPVRMPYAVAVAPKGAGFYGAGTNLAHNLPLGANPARDASAREHFNQSAARLWVPMPELQAAAALFQRHDSSGRPRERDHALAQRDVRLDSVPEPLSRPLPQGRSDPAEWTRMSPMAAVDETFLAFVQANPRLRPRVGNPDEMRSNRLTRTLAALKFRVTDPELGLPEALDGAIVTALNEEAVASAALGNKGGINLIASYEAFAMKMFGVIRQEVVFADHLNAAGRPPGWLSVPLVLTSHTWENAKNEQSHQDPSLAEAMLGEAAGVARVLFAADYNTAAAVMHAVYQTHGQVWAIVVPKLDSVPEVFTADEARTLVEQGALRLDWASDSEPALVLTAVGAYQLEQALLAGRRLRERGLRHSLVYMLEPARFRSPRNTREARHQAAQPLREDLYPATVPNRVFVGHTRPEPLLGLLQPLHTGHARCRALGFINQGGTLDVPGLLFLNKSSWAHVVEAAAAVTGRARGDFLSRDEMLALDNQISPAGVIIRS
jgi:phosphoketolase